MLEERVMSKNSSSSVFQKQSSESEAQVEASEQVTTASFVTNNLSETPNSCQSSSTFSSPPAKMIKRSSKMDVRNGNQCTIRLLDDNEILQCDVQVKISL